MSLAHNIQQGARTQDVRMPPNVTFETLLLTPKTLEGLKNSGFYKPSPIQLHGIPLGKCGFDLLLEAKSGTGKTAVFSIIALEKLDCRKGVQVVILAPTREIAAQICDVIKQIGSCYEGLEIEVVMGGLPVQEDIAKFRNKRVQVVVGSPGRLKHLIQDKHIDVNAVRLLVLDEADRLMEKSFQVDINNIFALLPQQKQVIMSSATFPEATKEFINQYVKNAQQICPDSDSVLLGIQQRFTVVKSNANIVKQTKYRLDELLKILSSHPFKQCLIFCNYQARVTELHKLLKKDKWPAEQLYGKQEQNDRLDALKTLQEYKCRILISTDLAARGIDASNVDLVINFEPPYEWQTYLHRIGRAGRFGSYGKAVTILSQGKERAKFKEMLKCIKNAAKLSNLWDDEKFESSDEEALTSEESSSNITLDSSKSSTTIESQLTSKELAKVEEKVVDIIKESSEAKPMTIESFSELQNSFASRATDNSVKKSPNKVAKKPINEEITVGLLDDRTLQTVVKKSPNNVAKKPINEEITVGLLDDKTLKTVIKTVTKMMTSSRETLWDIKSFPELEQSFQNFGVGEKAQEKGRMKDTHSAKQDYPKETGDIDNEVENQHENIAQASEDSAQTLENPCEPKNASAEVVFPAGSQTCDTNYSDKRQSTGDYDQSYFSNVAEALRQAGLPTAFGETKFNWNKPKSYPSTKTAQFENDNKNARRKSHKYDDSEDLTYKKSNRHQEAEYDETYDYGNYSRSHYRTKKYVSKRKSHTHHIYFENDADGEDNGTSSASSSVDLNINYLEWYKRLKQVTKQIEYSVYINELSKM